ncbi:hypothetical protein [Amycolatopsis vancoresmycina]|uniref:hypothetical protein n=1 Tax=Amycolatopsis vancoresmycina TaxID=208444 RepID=UPI0012DDB861|nr:hypothetical protein [Amycolatopsis vancoresmycina]
MSGRRRRRPEPVPGPPPQRETAVPEAGPQVFRHPDRLSLPALQRAAGNAAVNHLMRAHSVQRVVKRTTNTDTAQPAEAPTEFTARIGSAETVSLTCDRGDTVKDLIRFAEANTEAILPTFRVSVADREVPETAPLTAGHYRVEIAEANWADLVEEAEGEGEGDQARDPVFRLRLRGHTFSVTCDQGNTIADLKQFVVAQTRAKPATVKVFSPDGAPVDDASTLVDGKTYATRYRTRPARHAEAEKESERASDRASADFRLSPEVEEVLARGRYVNQDNPEIAESVGERNSLFHFIGEELAYTYNLKTCTAITLYCGQAKLAFLDHIDAGADVGRIAGQVEKFLAELLEARGTDRETVVQQLTVQIYRARGGEGPDSAFEVAEEALRRAGISTVNVDEVSGTDLIVVGGEKAPRRLEPGDVNLHDRVALRAYLEGDLGCTVLGESLHHYLDRSWRYARDYPELHPLLRAACDTAESRGDRSLARAFSSGLPEPTGVRWHNSTT